MIRKIKFSNFYSFNHSQEISFLAQKKKTHDYFKSKSGHQVTKIAGFIGSNASGKTNVMRFFSFLSYFVSRNTNNNDSELVPKIAYKTFFNNKKASNFHIEFEKDNFIFFYSFTIKNNTILKEVLFSKEIKKTSRKKEIFYRESRKIKRLSKEYFANLSIDLIPEIREDVSVIAFIKRSAYRIDLVDSLSEYFSSFKTNINEKGEINSIGLQMSTLEIYSNNPDIKKQVENFILKFDLGLKGFDIKKEKKEEGFTISVQGIHSGSKNSRLDLNYESRGTRSLFFTMANILSALKSNSIVIVDEIESGFHPEALNKLISFFINENENKNAQIFFSSHSLGFMNRLDMHQIFLVEKNETGESCVLRLNEKKGIRPDENFTAKYMSGAYGAFPKIRV